MLAPSTNSIPANADEASAAFARPHDYVTLDHGRLAYWRFGRGPDVVLIHGWPLHSATFRRIVPALARTFTLHLIDLPGTGHSEWDGPIDLASHATTLRKAIDAVGLSRYALLAHDSGAVVARLLAADDPRVQGLVKQRDPRPPSLARRALCLGGEAAPDCRARALDDALFGHSALVSRVRRNLPRPRVRRRRLRRLVRAPANRIAASCRRTDGAPAQPGLRPHRWPGRRARAHRGPGPVHLGGGRSILSGRQGAARAGPIQGNRGAY